MKLLFDENLSARLVELLAPEFPGSVYRKDKPPDPAGMALTKQLKQEQAGKK